MKNESRRQVEQSQGSKHDVVLGKHCSRYFWTFYTALLVDKVDYHEQTSIHLLKSLSLLSFLTRTEAHSRGTEGKPYTETNNVEEFVLSHKG